MIELPILGLLKEASLHGYELKRRLESIVGYFGKVSYGSLYPMLRKLEEHGQVNKIVEEQPGQRRITYQITSEGETRFLELMRDPGASFSLKMLFFESITPSDRRWLLEQQRDEWVRKLEERRRNQEQISGQGADRFVNRYRVALLARSIEHLERDIAWIQNLIKGEEQIMKGEDPS
ncbi:MAG: PadR family transcriptional regulator [Firmicutes bacterium]|nr:PadR family transcriptional regulator [Bacillota bacterium]